MSEANQEAGGEVTRESLIAAFQPFIEKGTTDPFDAMDGADEQSQQLSTMYDTWLSQESARISSLPLDEAVQAGIDFQALFFDAGFTDTNLLDHIAKDWLVNTLSLADDAHRRDLADKVKSKMLEVQKKIKELDPSYEITELDEPGEWNPSRNAAPKEFYADFAYQWGPEGVTIDAAVADYCKYHPDADTTAVKAEMEKAAQEYSEQNDA